MIQPLTQATLEPLFREIGQRLEGKAATLYLIGGMALHFLGHPRPTRDLDYIGSDLPAEHTDLQRLVEQVAETLKIPVEAVPLEEFLPLPAGAERRHRFIAEYGGLQAYVFDPYSIALSKIERGFEADLSDVLFLLRSGVIEWEMLQAQAQMLLPQATTYLIDPHAFAAHLEEVRQAFHE